MPPNHQTPKEVKKAIKSSDHTTNPMSDTKGPARNPRHALATDRKKISIHQIAAQNHRRAYRKPEWKGDIAELDLTSCSASGRHCISCSICASRPPQPPLSTFMGSITPPSSARRGRSSSSSSSPAARRERERGVRLTAGEKIGEGGRVLDGRPPARWVLLLRTWTRRSMPRAQWQVVGKLRVRG